MERGREVDVAEIPEPEDAREGRADHREWRRGEETNSKVAQTHVEIRSPRQ